MRHYPPLSSAPSKNLEDLKLTMFSTKEMPSASSMFSAYASISASIMLFRSMANDLIPYPLRGYLYSALGCLFKRSSNTLTLAIEQHNGITNNEVFEAAEVYLTTKINPNTERLRVSKSPKEKNLNIRLEKGEKVIDYYEGIQLKWRFVCAESERKDKHPFDQQPAKYEKRFFDLGFDKKHKDKVLNSYLPFVIARAKIMKDSQRVLKMHTLGKFSYSHGLKWEAINLEHPSTFETLAMDPEVKNSIIEDLNRFVRRKEFYKKVGRAWKRGYLLYGPPGTGKSSLIAAMANYLKFDIYDLQLTNVTCDSDLRKLLLATANKSILVIEDIDCGMELPDRLPHRNEDGSKRKDMQLTLSGLLNFIDGLWSSCGDERIIIFTTNHKEKLDPALLRPGRMDMHIHMSYCTYSGFKTLAFNYLGISGHAHHQFFGEIEALLKDTQVTPAQVAEEMMKGEDADTSLQGLVKLLKRKKMEGDDEDEVEDETPRVEAENCEAEEKIC